MLCNSYYCKNKNKYIYIYMCIFVKNGKSFRLIIDEFDTVFINLTINNM